MNYIVGDIGNTSTKIAILNRNFIQIKSLTFDTKNIFKKNNINKVFKKILKTNVNSKILFSSVVPLAYNKIKKHFKRTKFKVLEIKDLNIKKIIKINIKNFNQLGSDRIMNALAVKNFVNCLIVDFGTATTFDIIKNSSYQGGVIAPGIKISIQNLSNSTALLPFFKLRPSKKTYGKNTKEALNAGFRLGYEGLINNIIEKITSNRKIKYKIILTGGYAHFFKKMIKSRTIIDQNITIKGISRVYKELL